ncbi:hypothetical protein ACQKWADRAFT_80517 [Trichoderma austrokoningii]
MTTMQLESSPPTASDRHRMRPARSQAGQFMLSNMSKSQLADGMAAARAGGATRLDRLREGMKKASSVWAGSMRGKKALCVLSWSCRRPSPARPIVYNHTLSADKSLVVVVVVLARPPAVRVARVMECCWRWLLAALAGNGILLSWLTSHLPCQSVANFYRGLRKWIWLQLHALRQLSMTAFQECSRITSLGLLFSNLWIFTKVGVFAAFMGRSPCNKIHLHICARCHFDTRYRLSDLTSLRWQVMGSACREELIVLLLLFILFTYGCYNIDYASEGREALGLSLPFRAPYFPRRLSNSIDTLILVFEQSKAIYTTVEHPRASSARAGCSGLVEELLCLLVTSPAEVPYDLYTTT